MKHVVGPTGQYIDHVTYYVALGLRGADGLPPVAICNHDHPDNGGGSGFMWRPGIWAGVRMNQRHCLDWPEIHIEVTRVLQLLKEEQTMMGRGGNDRLDGSAGSDLLFSGAGRDTISGGAGQDFIFGSGRDTVHGGDGKDCREGRGVCMREGSQPRRHAGCSRAWPASRMNAGPAVDASAWRGGA